MKCCLSEPEPRIHFALNCGAKSCPPVKVFTGKGVEEELDVVTGAFVEGAVGPPGLQVAPRGRGHVACGLDVAAVNAPGGGACPL